MTRNQSQRGASTRVFVYGSLLSGEGNHRLLADAYYVGLARTAPAFTLYDMGAFPGLVGGGRDAVHGEVYVVDAEVLARLDRLEGHPSFYCRVPIGLADGSTAETYLLPPAKVVGRMVIMSGSWRAHHRTATVR